MVTVWNLEERRIHTIIREAHLAPLLSLHFFPGEPRLMSAAADNSIKQWLFDSADETGRLLRYRSGHSAPPTIVRHYGDTNRLLSAGPLDASNCTASIQTIVMENGCKDDPKGNPENIQTLASERLV